MRLLLAVLAILVTAAPAAAQDLQEIRVPMRDGVELAVDLYMPKDVPPGEKVPVILTLTPYHVLYKALNDAAGLTGYRFLQQGYAFAYADVRGTYESGGCWDYGGIKERQDGYDLVEWLGTQPWSNGKVGMIGGSYDGTTANAAAVERPPHLATIVPISAISRWWGYAYTQGVRHSYSGTSADIDPPSDTPLDFMFAYGFLPPPQPGAVSAADQIAMRWTPCDRVNQTLHGYDLSPDYDDFWTERDYLQLADRVEVPTLVTHGLQDENVKTWEGTQWFEALKSEKAMLIGNWGHGESNWSEWDDFLDRWFARWLKGAPNKIEREPAVRVVKGEDDIQLRENWTGYGRRTETLGTEDAEYLDDGTLTENEMLQNGCTGGRCVKVDLPGLAGMHLQGRARIKLRATSDQPSTHFVAWLLDVAPGGAEKIISRGYMNGRYRKGLQSGVDIVPGEKDTYEIELIDKDYVVAPDHTVQLVLASSNVTWVVSDERRATNTLHLAESTIEVPVPGPAPAGPPPAPKPPVAPAPAPAAPAPGSSAPAAAPCRARRLSVRVPRGTKRLRVTVGGKRVKRARVRRGRVTVTLPRSATGRVLVRVTGRARGRAVRITRRAATCR